MGNGNVCLAQIQREIKRKKRTIPSKTVTCITTAISVKVTEYDSFFI